MVTLTVGAKRLNADLQVEAPLPTAVREMSPCSSLEPRFKDEDDYERGRDLTSSVFVYSCKIEPPENFSMYFFSAEKLARLLVFVKEG